MTMNATHCSGDLPKKTLQDAKGRALVIGDLIGIGPFSRVFRVQEESSGDVFTARLPLSPDDLEDKDNAKSMIELSTRLVRDHGAQLRKLPPPLEIEVLGVVDGGGGAPCLIAEYLEGSLLDHLRGGMRFDVLCSHLAEAARSLVPLHARGGAHGNLKPGNIFITEEEDALRVRFTDPLTQGYLHNLDALAERRPSLPAWIPPELRGKDVRIPLPRLADSWALARILYEAVMNPDALVRPSAAHQDGIPEGIDKAALEHFREVLAKRLDADGANPHVAQLLVRRASALIGRALSGNTAPSPPYRFDDIEEFASRLEELRELFRPGFEQVGLLLADDPGRTNNIYRPGESIVLYLAFRCQGGLEDPDLIQCMTYIRDLDNDRKVKGNPVEVTPSHDRNRFRFSFRIPPLPEGRYLIRVALGVKGSEGKPIPRDFVVEIQPHPEETRRHEGAGSRKETKRDGRKPGTAAGGKRTDESSAFAYAPAPAAREKIRIPGEVEKPGGDREGARASSRGQSAPRPSKPSKQRDMPRAERRSVPPKRSRTSASRDGEPRQAGPRQAEPRQAGPRQAGPRQAGPPKSPPKGRAEPKNADLVWIAEDERTPPATPNVVDPATAETDPKGQTPLARPRRSSRETERVSSGPTKSEGKGAGMDLRRLEEDRPALERIDLTPRTTIPRAETSKERKKADRLAKKEDSRKDKGMQKKLRDDATLDVSPEEAFELARRGTTSRPKVGAAPVGADAVKQDKGEGADPMEQLRALERARPIPPPPAKETTAEERGKRGEPRSTGGGKADEGDAGMRGPVRAPKKRTSFIAERVTPPRTEEPDPFFKKGALTPTQQAALVGVLVFILVALIGAVFWVLE